MYPHERSLVKRLAAEPFVLLGVNTDRDRDKLKEVMKREQITWRCWFDGGTDGPISTRWNVRAFPATYVLDHRGVIRFKGVRDEDMDEAVDTLVREMKAGAPK
jgi:hypothetical protein